MTRFHCPLVVALAALAAGPAAAQSLSVIPQSLATTEGNSASNLVFSTSARTSQFVWSSSLVAGAGVTPGSVITGFSPRQNGGAGTWPGTSLTITSYQVTMSTSANAPGSLSTTFANNLSADAVVTRSGPLSVTANSYPGGAGPNPFGPVIPFTSPFTYSGGDLLMELRFTATVTGSMQDSSDSTAGMSSVFNVDNTASTGIAGTLVPVIQFQFTPVPEPGTLTMLAAVGSGAGLTWYRRRRTAGGNG